MGRKGAESGRQFAKKNHISCESGLWQGLKSLGENHLLHPKVARRRQHRSFFSSLLDRSSTTLSRFLQRGQDLLPVLEQAGHAPLPFDARKQNAGDVCNFLDALSCQRASKEHHSACTEWQIVKNQPIAHGALAPFKSRRCFTPGRCTSESVRAI